jgi:dihydroneopterin aldolase
VKQDNIKHGVKQLNIYNGKTLIMSSFMSNDNLSAYDKKAINDWVDYPMNIELE